MKKIKESNSAKDYKKWMLEGKPRYLEMKGKKNKVRMIARFRCCNKWKGERYWKKKKREYAEHVDEKKKHCII